MVFDKSQSGSHLDHAIRAEFSSPSTPHPVFGQDPLDIAIVFLNILGNVIQALLIDFPNHGGGISILRPGMT